MLLDTTVTPANIKTGDFKDLRKVKSELSALTWAVHKLLWSIHLSGRPEYELDGCAMEKVSI